MLTTYHIFPTFYRESKPRETRLKINFHKSHAFLIIDLFFLSNYKYIYKYIYNYQRRSLRFKYILHYSGYIMLSVAGQNDLARKACFLFSMADRPITFNGQNY